MNLREAQQRIPELKFHTGGLDEVREVVDAIIQAYETGEYEGAHVVEDELKNRFIFALWNSEPTDEAMVAGEIRRIDEANPTRHYA